MCLTTPTAPTYNLKIVGVYEPETININIKTQDDEFDMDVDPDAMVKEVFADYIEKNTIQFAGVELDIEDTIYDNGIDDGATISIIANEEEEIDVYEHKLEVSGSRLYSVKTRMNPTAFLDVAREHKERETLPIVKDCGYGDAPIVEEHIDMSEYIIITKRTPLYVWYNYYFQDQPILIDAKERIRIKDIPKTVKCRPFDENNMRLGAIDGDKLVKGENIHLWKGLVRHQNVFDYHRN